MSKIIKLSLLLAFIAFLALPSQAGPLLKRSPLGTSQGVSVDQLVYRSGSLAVRGRLYLPQSTDKQLPLVIFSHDGIDGITKSHHKSCIRLAQQGYAVIAPSYRGEDGSEGTIEIAKGEVDDVLNLWPCFSSIEEIDPQRVVLMGASHGALVSLLASARQPQVKGVIFAYGVADIYAWWDYLKSHNKLGRDPITLRTYGDGPQARPQSFALRHGISAVPKIKAPVLILQGSLDDTTPQPQGEALHKALQDQGKESYIFIYPHALHGFLVYAPYLKSDVTAEEKAEAEEAWQEVFGFLKRTLR